MAQLDLGFSLKIILIVAIAFLLITDSDSKKFWRFTVTDPLFFEVPQVVQAVSEGRAPPSRQDAQGDEIGSDRSGRQSPTRAARDQNDSE